MEKDVRLDKSVIYRVCHQITTNRFFSYFINVVIIFNTIDLALDKYPLDISYFIILERVNLIIAMTFIFEMLLKLVAFGFKFYCKDRLNWLDCLIVIQSFIDFFFYLFLSNEGALATTALRALRLARVFKLARSWRRF